MSAADSVIAAAEAERRKQAERLMEQAGFVRSGAVDPETGEELWEPKRRREGAEEPAA